MDSKISQVVGRGVPVSGDDIDTDRIMPARYLKCVTFEHIGKFTFQDERFTPEGKPKGHPFDDPKFKGASILVVNKNFGCGSSREHAPQGILRWGIKAIVGESFAEIFAGNCAAIGLPAVTASSEDVILLQKMIQADPAGEAVLDLKAKTLAVGGKTFSVDMKESARSGFLEGTWDSTATLLSALDRVKQVGNTLPYLGWAEV